MYSFSYFIIFIPILGFILLFINFLLAPHVPYKEKKTPFECGLHSFMQTRLPFEIKPIIFILMYVIFDVEIVFAFPFSVSTNANEQFGLFMIEIFIFVLGMGFVYELGKRALTIDSRQNNQISKDKSFESVRLISKNIHVESNVLHTTSDLKIFFICVVSLFIAVILCYI